MPFDPTTLLNKSPAFVRRFLAPPVFDDEDKTRQAAMLNTLLLASLAIGLIGLVALLAFGAANRYNAITAVVMYASLLGLRELMRRGHVRTTVVLTLALVMLVNSITVINVGTIRTQRLGIYFVIVFGATMLLGPLEGFIFALFSIVIVLGMALAELNGVLPESFLPGPVNQWVTFSGLVTVVYIFVVMTRRVILNSLSRARAELAQRQRAEQASRASQARLDGIISSAMDAIVTIDDRQVVTMFNNAAERLFLCSAEEAIGQPLDRFIPDRYRALHKEHVRRFAESGVTSRKLGSLGTLSGLRANGVEFPIEASISRMENEGKEYFTAILRDVTEREQAESLLRESEGRFRAIVEDQTDLICRYLSDGTLTFANQAFERCFGGSGMSLPGGKFELPIDPEDMAIVTSKRAKLSPENPLITYWCRVHIPEAGTHWQEWTERILVNEQTSRIEFQAVGQDITERKRAEQAIRRYNEELLALNSIAATMGHASSLETRLTMVLERTIETLNADGGWIYLLDEKRRSAPWVMVAEAGLTYLGVGELVEIHIPASNDRGGPADLVSEILLRAVQPHLEVEGRQDRPVVAGTPIWTKDTAQGVLCVLKQHPAELGDEERQLLSTIGRQLAVMIDNARLSEKAAENELLRELDRLRSELVANVSHELRTPLGLIMIACTTLLREDIQFDNRTQRSFLNDIVAEANRLERIVDNLLDLSRLQSGKMRLKRQPTELRTLSEQTLETMQSQFAEHRFVSDFPPDGVVANVDSRLIEQVLRNLLGNAGKYSPSGTPITIHGEELEQEILIAVSDRGVGIPAHDLERIFERFYRVQRDDEVEASGIGLGLAVCRGIIEAHGGRIWVESEVGEGSTFYFTLPFTAVETQASGHTRAEHPGQALAEPRSGDR